VAKNEVSLHLHTTVNYQLCVCVWYKGTEEPLWSFVASGESVKDLSKWQISQQPKLAQLDKALCKWFMTMLTTRNSINGLMKIEKKKNYIFLMIKRN